MTNETTSANSKCKYLVACALTYGIMSIENSSTAIPQNLTGHQSADLATGRTELTQLEKTIYTSIFKKLNIESRTH